MSTKTSKVGQAPSLDNFSEYLLADTGFKNGRQHAQRKQVSCHVCNKPIVKYASRIAKSKRHFCSQKCYHSIRQDGRYKPSRQGQRVARTVVSKYFTLAPENVVHHEDRNNKHNDLANLRVFANQADHMAYHHGNPNAVPIWDGRECGVPK